MQTANAELQKVELRPTVAGLLVKRDYKGIHIGIHQSVRAKNKGYIQDTTVGGGIELLEKPFAAMERELDQEYSKAFAQECSIEALLGSPQEGEGWSGTKKCYWWFLIVYHGSTVPTLQVEECADFRWCPLPISEKDPTLQRFSDRKRKMIMNSLNIAKSLYPQIFK